MRSLKEASILVGEVVGSNSNSSKAFENQVNDHSIYVRSMAMTSKLPRKRVRLKLQKMCQRILMISIKMFIKDKYGGYTTTKSDVVYDKNMNPIVEIQEIRKRQAEIIDILLSNSMEEFMKGRELAKLLINRSKKNEERRKKLTTPTPAMEAAAAANTYKEIPPFEMIEIEAINIENKLPNISREEGQRLSLLYEMIRNHRELQSEIDIMSESEE